MPSDKDYEDFLKSCMTGGESYNKPQKYINFDDVPSKKVNDPNSFLNGCDVTQIKPSEDMKPGDEDNGIMGDDNNIWLY